MAFGEPFGEFGKAFYFGERGWGVSLLIGLDVARRQVAVGEKPLTNFLIASLRRLVKRGVPVGVDEIERNTERTQIIATLDRARSHGRPTRHVTPVGVARLVITPSAIYEVTHDVYMTLPARPSKRGGAVLSFRIDVYVSREKISHHIRVSISCSPV